MIKLRTFISILFIISIQFLTAEEKPVHIFILSGQSNMAHMDPETGFLPEAQKLFKDEKVVYIKVAQGGKPIALWVKEWPQIAEKHKIQSKRIKLAYKSVPENEMRTVYYKPIIEQYWELIKKYPNPSSVTFCWMQGERDGSGKYGPAYEEALTQLISNLRRDLKRDNMNFVIARIGDANPGQRQGWLPVREAQLKVVNADPRGAWVDCDDLNDGKSPNAVHYAKEDYVRLGQRFARQGHALAKGEEPAADGRP